MLAPAGPLEVWERRATLPPEGEPWGLPWSALPLGQRTRLYDALDRALARGAELPDPFTGQPAANCPNFGPGAETCPVRVVTNRGEGWAIPDDARPDLARWRFLATPRADSSTPPAGARRGQAGELGPVL